MAKDFIVAIEIGSSKITGIAGRKNTDGSISVLAVAKEDPSMCIRKGVTYNLDRTVQCLTNIIGKLKTSLKTDIAYAYVGIGGQSIRSVKNTLVRELPEDAIVSQDMVDGLMDANRSMAYPEQEILDAITQEYKLDMQYQLDPVGVQCSRLEGHFLNILWRSSHYRNLKKCLSNAGIAIADVCIAPLALADSVLTESEKRSGCVLVDLGAQTTTIAVYFKNILRHLVVIPLGGYNITKDIASLQIDEQKAEQIKLKYASAYTDSDEVDDTLKFPIDNDRSIENHRLVSVVEARLDEIIKNVRYQIPDEYVDHLLGGLVLTGGGAKMKNIEEAFRKLGQFSKIRTAKFVNQVILSKNPDITSHDGTMNTVLGLLAKGNQNCAGNEITDDLFREPVLSKPTTLPSEDPQQAADLKSASENTAHPSPNGMPTDNHSSSTKAPNATDDEPEDREQGPGLLGKLGKTLGNFLRDMAKEE